ncbi:MAG: ornithine cyclodeaminase family protein [Calditrichia bacterium]
MPIPIVIDKQEIISALESIDIISAMQAGFIAYSNGQAVVPPVGELLFEQPKGEAHIKYGYIKSEPYYVIKIASGFYDNPQMGLSSSQGLMLLFSQQTGQAIAILLDEGHLTDVRTAAAGALAAKYFAPNEVNAIGILGTGIQARFQLEYLQHVRPCKNVWIWGRTPENVQKLKVDLNKDFDIQIAGSPAEVAHHANLIVTTTPSGTPLLKADDIRPGTHITAVGSDTSTKQELQSEILERADLVIADSIPQSKSRGEIFRALKAGVLLDENITELGIALQNNTLRRTNETQISIVDLTGVAVQDIMIASAVYNAFKR